MSDVGRVQIDSSNQSQIESNNMLVVSGLSVTSQNKRILEDINFKVKKGTSLAVVGPNGGGKTTLFRALLNLIPYAGKIKWNDEVRIGYVPQSLVSLSGGELQRVLIAWAIVDNPSVLLFDEPTSGVDIGAEEPIYENVNHLKREAGITVLLISHNMHVVMHYSDYVLALNKGVLFFGDTKSLTHSQLLSIIFGSEFALTEEEH